MWTKIEMKKSLYRIWSKFLTVFGDIRYSKYPPFLFYDDVNFAVSGDKIEKIMNIIEPGDVVLRGFDSYIDSLFIKSSKKYSHAGVYVGGDEIIHAIAPNVSKDHLIDFCHCDRIAILRPSKDVENGINTAKKFYEEKVDYDFIFSEQGVGKSSLYCFELAAYCYKNLEIEKMKATALFGLIKKKEKVYLSDSFFNSKDFKLVYECNPRFNIEG